MSDNPNKYEVLIEQYLHSILDMSDFLFFDVCRYWAMEQTFNLSKKRIH